MFSLSFSSTGNIIQAKHIKFNCSQNLQHKLDKAFIFYVKTTGKINSHDLTIAKNLLLTVAMVF
jgi:hypothetical protein